jgi:nucleoside-diphosphate-sugar epimerase
VTARLGIFGASGFVGSALCERLWLEDRRDFLPFVHSTGNAWRIARFPIGLHTVNLLDRDQVQRAVSECDVVVNCALARGDTRARGMRNLVGAMKKAGTRRFVHLSSIAVYGQDPAPDTVAESAALAPGHNRYGRLKQRQDEVVGALGAAGIPYFILCPGNVSGPYSPFMIGLARRLACGPLPLVDGGRNPSNLIHIDNLVEAILVAARSEVGAQQRYFVNEVEPVPWRRIFDDMSGALGFEAAYVDVPRDRVLPLLDPPEPRIGLTESLRIALSGEVRAALSRIPLFRALDDLAMRVFTGLPRKTQLRVRERASWPIRPAQAPVGPSLDDRYVRVQARRYYHSPRKLGETLGWQPPLTYEEGLRTTIAWLRFAGLARQEIP